MEPILLVNFVDYQLVDYKQTLKLYTKILNSKIKQSKIEDTLIISEASNKNYNFGLWNISAKTTSEEITLFWAIHNIVKIKRDWLNIEIK